MYYLAITIALLVLVILILTLKRENMTLAEYGITNPSPLLLAKMRAAYAKAKGTN